MIESITVVDEKAAWYWSWFHHYLEMYHKNLFFEYMYDPSYEHAQEITKSICGRDKILIGTPYEHVMTMLMEEVQDQVAIKSEWIK